MKRFFHYIEVINEYCQGMQKAVIDKQIIFRAYVDTFNEDLKAGVNQYFETLKVVKSEYEKNYQKLYIAFKEFN